MLVIFVIIILMVANILVEVLVEVTMLELSANYFVIMSVVPVELVVVVMFASFIAYG